ncbi:Arm DNA-binding domain-containing protein [Mycoavidus sp. B2-EB]|uniref:Arm DNA-binding domain-containing protein n=1 Tax=Mycoavidus sp. B2-EB TaxID=2651972 RepID=UPI001E57AAA6|nr:Arm DNA-binding domain-containing protein [Mycoavidus sp. B2-EB]
MWRYRYRFSGRYGKLTLGKYPALTLKNARLKRDEAACAIYRHQLAIIRLLLGR